jgi:hypothetical protein
MVADGIAAFWSWWPAAHGRIEAAIGGGGFPKALVSEIAARVGAIDADLDWELSPGNVAQHAFCLSAKGDPVLRRTTERWLAAAPAADSTWEFHPARIGRPRGDDAHAGRAPADVLRAAGLVRGQPRS